jgi:hypothetical protein
VSCPDFIVIGAAKCATTTLADYLARHPAICMSRPKEPEVFARVRDIDERTQFETLFQHRKPGQRLGEASTIYTRFPNFPDVPRRMHAIVPKVRLIYLMREPVERTFADYAMIQRYWMNTRAADAVTCTFEEALLSCDPLLASIRPTSNYVMQIEQYLAFFPKEQMLFLLMDDLSENPVDTLAHVCAFLGVATDHNLVSMGPIRSNSRENYENHLKARMMARWLSKFPMAQASKRVVPDSVRMWIYESLAKTSLGKKVADNQLVKPMREETRAELHAYFRDSVDRLESLIGRDLSRWRVHVEGPNRIDSRPPLE